MSAIVEKCYFIEGISIKIVKRIAEKIPKRVLLQFQWDPWRNFQINCRNSYRGAWKIITETIPKHIAGKESKAVAEAVFKKITTGINKEILKQFPKKISMMEREIPRRIASKFLKEFSRKFFHQISRNSLKLSTKRILKEIAKKDKEK